MRTLQFTLAAVATTVLMREARKPGYAICTLAPRHFVGRTHLTAGVQAIRSLYLPLASLPAMQATCTFGLVTSIVTGVLLLGVAAVIVGSAIRRVDNWRVRRDRAGGRGEHDDLTVAVAA